MVQEFQENDVLLKSQNTTFLSLIPKVHGTSNMKEFIPINLRNTLYKIITKNLANRLQEFPSELISNEQHSFVRGKQIVDEVITMHEIIHYINYKK